MKKLSQAELIEKIEEYKAQRVKIVAKIKEAKKTIKPLQIQLKALSGNIANYNFKLKKARV